MSWPASQQTVEDAFDAVNRTAITIKQRVVFFRDASAAGPTERSGLVALQQELSRAVTVMDTAASFGQAMIDHARQQFRDPTLDVSAKFTAMRSEIEALRAWLHANFPRHTASQAVLENTVGPDGQRIPLTFTSVQLDGFRTQADLLIATIK